MASKKPPKLGTVNGYVSSVFKMGNKKLAFDGTTKGLVNVALANGAKTGTKLRCNYGGTSYDPKFCDTIMIVESDASGRMWATRQWAEEKAKAAKTPKANKSNHSPKLSARLAAIDEWQSFNEALSNKQYALARKLTKAMKDAENKESAEKYLAKVAAA